MATAQLYVYNETETTVNVSSTSYNMAKAPLSLITIQPGSPYTQDVVSNDSTSTFTLSTDASHVLTASYSSTTGEYSIAPTSFDDGTFGALVAPVTVNNIKLDVLNFLVGDGEPVAYLNGLLAALVPPAVAELNKTAPHEVTINNIDMSLIKLDLSASNLSCTYASRQGTGDASFNMQAVLDLSTVGATVNAFGSNYDVSMANLAALVTFTANTNPVSLQIQSLQFSLPDSLQVGGFTISGTDIARGLNSEPANQEMISKLNATLSGGLRGGVSQTLTPAAMAEAKAPGWAAPLATVIAQYGPA